MKAIAYSALETSTNVPVNFHDDVKEEESDFGLLPDAQILVGGLLDAAAASAQYDNEETMIFLTMNKCTSTKRIITLEIGWRRLHRHH